jgi:MFS family permease
MADALDKKLDRWIAAGLLDNAGAARIRAFEHSQRSTEGLRWPVLLALALGGLLLCAGVLLFVAAHWDELSPASRFTLVLLMVALFPIAGALTAERFAALSSTFYAIGTVCVGAGIFLAAQIFNLQEHWPSGILLWAVGVLVGWLLLRQWPQAVLLALLVPAWLAGEWEVRAEGHAAGYRVVLEGLLLLAISYLTARSNEDDCVVRRALTWIGGISLLPLGVLAFTESRELLWSLLGRPELPFSERILAWVIAIGAPLLLAWVLRRGKSWANVAAAAWVLVIGTFGPVHSTTMGTLSHYAWNTLGLYFWAGIGALGLVGWGLLERRRERINLGVAGFALTVTIFYFSDVMDKLGRSASLIGLGVLFLFGGWMLERTRRRLIAHVAGGSQ